MLNGKLVKLRPILKQDINKLNDWKNNYEIFKYLGGGFSPQSIDNQEKYMEVLMDNSKNTKRFIIEIEGVPGGVIGLYDINWTHRNCNLGMYIGEKIYWGKGYGVEALKLIENYAKNNLNLRKIKFLMVSENEKAVSFFKKYDYKEIGIYKEDRFIDGKYLDVSIMEKFI